MSRMRCALLVFVFSLLASHAGAKDYLAWRRDTQLFEDGSLVYWVHTPPAYNEDPNRRYPLLVILHWSYVRGRSYLHYWRPDGDAHNVIIAAPNSRGGASWIPADGSNIERMIEQVSKNYSVDPDRIWLAGYSAGGVYVYHLLFKYPHLFHAVLPIGGRVGRHRSDAPPAKVPKRTRVCLFHGEWDRNIKFAEAERDLAFLTEQGYEVDFHEMKKFGHWIPRSRGAEMFACLNGVPLEGLPPPAFPRRGAATEERRARATELSYSTYRIPSTGVSLPARPAE